LEKGIKKSRIDPTRELNPIFVTNQSRGHAYKEIKAGKRGEKKIKSFRFCVAEAGKDTRGRGGKQNEACESRREGE